jgi:hypothetical protein
MINVLRILQTAAREIDKYIKGIKVGGDAVVSLMKHI